MLKFDELENRIEQMEAEADLVNFGRKASLEEEFEQSEAFCRADLERQRPGDVYVTIIHLGFAEEQIPTPRDPSGTRG